MEKLKFLVILMILISSCAQHRKSTTGKNVTGNTYVLIHGAYHGKWCWEKLTPYLQRKGHKVVAIDLPSHGNDDTPPEEVTLNSYTNKVYETLKNIDEKVILVGHSLGGISISNVAEKSPEKIKALVYLTAVLPKDGETLVSVEDPNPNGIQFYEFSEDGKTVNVISEMVKEVFYSDCKDKDVEFALSNLSPQPLAPIITPVNLTEMKFGAIPRFFIECTNDNVFSIELQRLWQKRSPCKAVFTMDTGHSPFLAAPKELAEILDKIE